MTGVLSYFFDKDYWKTDSLYTKRAVLLLALSRFVANGITLLSFGKLEWVGDIPLAMAFGLDESGKYYNKNKELRS